MIVELYNSKTNIYIFFYYNINEKYKMIFINFKYKNTYLKDSYDTENYTQCSMY